MLRHSIHALLEDRVSRRLAPILLLLALACGGVPGNPVPEDVAPTPEVAVRNFMQAVADSNITRMGRYWGTTRGPASLTRHPSDYLQRLQITQAFLRGSPYRVLRSDPERDQPNRQSVTVEFTRTDRDGKSCARVTSIGVIRTGDQGWIITRIDLTDVGTPGRACASPAKTGP
jgi:hypothetical protein